MMQILSWNIQAGKGCDGVVDLDRIARVIRTMSGGDGADVMCLQEVSRGLTLAGADGGAPDQVSELAQLFATQQGSVGAALSSGLPLGGDEPVGAALGEATGQAKRWAFGNAVLVRLPVLWLRQHGLPRPAHPGIRHMPRQATELCVQTSQGPLRIMATHLEYHSEVQRLAQVGRLCGIHEEAVTHAIWPPVCDVDGPYQAIAGGVACVMCGDFNFEVGSAPYARMLAPLDATRPHEAHADLDRERQHLSDGAFLDAWRVCHGDNPHAPTCGIYDTVQWSDGAHCRDFFFVTASLQERLKDLVVNTQTDASDHQPLMLSLR